MIESSSTAEPPKLFPTSTNVGSDPVVIPLMRWRVAVGGSEKELNMKEFPGCAFVSWAGNFRIPW